MTINTYLPCDRLKPYIKAFVITESIQTNTYNILPDTSMVMGFQYKGKLSYLTDDNEIALSSSGISGLNDSFRTFKNSNDTGTLLVIFKESGAANFFKEPANELFRKSISIDNLENHSNNYLEEQLTESTDNLQRIRIIENYLISHILDNRNDILINDVVNRINKSNGQVKIFDLLKELYISQSALEKRFRKVVGTSPKKFADIVRMKSILNQYNNETNLTELAYKAGFFDQSHFIKDFKCFTGKTPDKYFSEK